MWQVDNELSTSIFYNFSGRHSDHLKLNENEILKLFMGLFSESQTQSLTSCSVYV